MTKDDFKAGDRVQHMRGAIGTVTRVTRETVHVTFDGAKPYRGEYDELWFSIYPNGLKPLQQTPGA